MKNESRFLLSRRFSFIVAIFWTGVVIVLLSLPGANLPKSSLWEYDKIGHAGLFFFLALAWLNAFSADRKPVIAVILICGLILAPLSEWYQSVASIDRTADIYDSLADAVGFGLGTLVWVAFLSLRKTGKQK